MNYSTIILEKKEQYCIIKLNRVQYLNVINELMLKELSDCIFSIKQDNTIKAIIITGSGDKAFSAGADIKKISELDYNSGKAFSEFGSKVLKQIADLNILCIAAINGIAYGGGCELSLACHLRFCSITAKLALPEINLGIIPGFGATYRLPHIIGYAKAIELIISGKIIDSNYAMEIGLVNNVFKDDELLIKTEEFVLNIIKKPINALYSVIESINNSTIYDENTALAMESDLFGKLCNTKEAKEAFLSFLNNKIK